MPVLAWLVDHLLAPIAVGLVTGGILAVWGHRHVRVLHARLDVQDQHLDVQDDHLATQDETLDEVRRRLN